MKNIPYEGLSDEIYSLYADNGKIPDIKDVSIRLLQEVFELCLVAGASPTEIIMSIADSMYNEALKAKSYPSDMTSKYDSNSFPLELADVSLHLLSVMKVYSVEPGTIERLGRLKIEDLHRSLDLGKLKFNDKGLFYIQK